MDQRRIELVSNCAKLENECEITNTLLKEMLNRNSRAVNSINNLTNNELLKNTDIFLKISKQIYNAIHKVMSINFNLENFILSDTTCDASSIKQFDSKTSTEVSCEENICNGPIKEPFISMKSSSSIYTSVFDNTFAPENVENELLSNKEFKVCEQEDLYNGESAIQKLEIIKPKCQRETFTECLKEGKVPDISFKRSYRTASEYKSISKGSSQSSLSVSTNKDNFKFKSSSFYSKNIVLQESPTPSNNDLCVLSSVVNPSEFYINVCNESTAELDSLGEKLTDYGNNSNFKFMSKTHAKEYISKYCVVYNEEWKQWYRAEIINWFDDFEVDIQVQLVDYGEYSTVPITNVLVLPQQFCVTPKLAIRCHFAYLYPPGSTDAILGTDWPNESFEILNTAIEKSEDIYRLVFVDNQKKSLAVDLISIEETNEEKTLGQIMLDLGHAIQIIQDQNAFVKNDFIKDQIKTAHGMAGICESMSPEEQLEKFCNNLQINEPSTIGEALTMYDAQDEKRTCRFARKDGTCFKGLGCRLDHKPLRNDGYTTDKKEIYTCAFNKLPIPKTGDVLEIIITFVCSINKFYAQIRNYDSNGQKLKQLLYKMNQKKNIINYKPFKILPAAGELVLTQYGTKWYRAMVREISTNVYSPDIVVQVFFVDFGDIMDVQLKDIREIESDFLYLPFQAVRFSINNIEPKANNVDEAKEYFETRYLCQNVNATVIYSAESYLDVLISTKDGYDIGLQLIEDGFADFRTNLIPNSNNVLLVD